MKRPEKISYVGPESTLKADIRRALNKEHHRQVGIAQTLRTGTAKRQSVKEKLELIEKFMNHLDGVCFLEIRPELKPWEIRLD